MISKNTEKAIEDAVSEAASDDKKNPTSRYNTQKGRNNTAKYGRKAKKKKKKLPATPAIPSDPTTPYQDSKSKVLTRTNTLADEQVNMSEGSTRGLGATDIRRFESGSTRENLTKKFALGGEVKARGCGAAQTSGFGGGKLY